MLAVSDLAARYGRAEVLAGVSLDAAAGEVLVLLGRNGAGKSTTMKAIMGLVRPAAGRVVLKGRDITGTAPFEAARLGYVPETGASSPGSRWRKTWRSAASRRRTGVRPGRRSGSTRCSRAWVRCGRGPAGG